MIVHPRAARNSSRSISRARRAGSVQCCAPSYSTATLYCGQPISRRYTGCPSSSRIRIWVTGRGNPAAINKIRVRDSGGDSALPSATSRAFAALRTPRKPGCWPIAALASSTVQPLTRSKASIRGTAMSNGNRRAMSNAVRAGVVTRMSPTRQVSLPLSVSLYTQIPFGALRLARMSSAGSDASSQRIPSTAAALQPARVADRPDHSHAATALSLAVSSKPLLAYTLRKSLV